MERLAGVEGLAWSLLPAAASSPLSLRAKVSEPQRLAHLAPKGQHAATRPQHRSRHPQLHAVPPLQSEGVSRRLLASTTAVASACLFGQRRARAQSSVREMMANAAAGLPGYGPADVYFPQWLAGSWLAKRELVGVETPQGEELAGDMAAKAKAMINTPAASDEYPLRFISYRGNVISDRRANLRAVFLDADKSTEFFDVEWDATNPNVVQASLRQQNGTVRNLDMRVARRAVGVPDGREADLFNFSELYQQSIFVSASGRAATVGGPSPVEVTPLRCLTKYRRVSADEVLQLQRFEVYPYSLSEVGAGDWGGVISKQLSRGDPDRPLAIYRYQVRLTALPSTSDAGARTAAATVRT